MKFVPNRLLLIVVVFFLQQTSVFADAAPPPPSSPPPPPGLPLDGGVLVLFMALSLCYGIYILNKKNIKKASN
jgi:hypothetical protein